MIHWHTFAMRNLSLLLAVGLSTCSSAAFASMGILPLTERQVGAELILAAKQSARNEQEAAQLATRQYGGKVLRVQRQGDSFEVRLLLDSGRIKHVSIPASKGSG